MAHPTTRLVLQLVPLLSLKCRRSSFGDQNNHRANKKEYRWKTGWIPTSRFIHLWRHFSACQERNETKEHLKRKREETFRYHFHRLLPNLRDDMTPWCGKFQRQQLSTLILQIALLVTSIDVLRVLVSKWGDLNIVVFIWKNVGGVTLQRNK